MDGCFNSIIIVGKIASGKTTLANELSKRLNATIISFGGYLRHIAQDKGLKPERNVLQTIGLEMINTRSPHQFVNDVVLFGLEEPCHQDSLLIFEGVRHISVLNEIREISRNSIVIYIELDGERLLKNAINRDGGDSQSAKRFLNHRVESEISELKDEADYVLSNMASEKDIQEIVCYINNKFNSCTERNTEDLTAFENG